MELLVTVALIGNVLNLGRKMKTGLVCWLFISIIIAVIGHCGGEQIDSDCGSYDEHVEEVKNVLSFECSKLCVKRRWCTNYKWRPDGTCYLKRKKKTARNAQLCSGSTSNLMKTNSYYCLIWISCLSWIYLFKPVF